MSHYKFIVLKLNVCACITMGSMTSITMVTTQTASENVSMTWITALHISTRNVSPCFHSNIS